MSDMTIGQRIKTRRILTGKSIRQISAEAGISDPQWSRIENGRRSADNRFVLANIARVLKCSVPDLTGESTAGTPHTPEGAALVGSVNSIVAALVETDLADEATVEPVTLDQLAAEAALLDDLRSRSDYAGAASRLPWFTRQLHATAVSPGLMAAEHAAALRLTVLGSDRTGGILRNVGFRAEAFLAGERARDAAQELDEPVMLALAAWSRAHAALGCGSMARAHSIAVKGLAAVEGHLDDTGGKEVRGQLHLTAAMCLYGLGQASEAETHMAEAEALAVQTGDTTTYRLWFGPTNLQLWKLAITLDAGDPGDAVQIVRGTNPAPLTPGRQGAFYLDAARALSRIGKPESDKAALRMLETAERLVPQRVHHSPLAAEALRMIVERVKRSAVDSRLRGLAERLGVAA